MENQLQVIYLPIDKLTADVENAKEHPAEQVEQIKKSIKRFKMCDPIGITGENNLILEGHGRYIALKALGVKEVPCIRLDHLKTKEERDAYSLIHNKLTMNSGFNVELLELKLDNIVEINMEEFGFELPEAETEAREDDYEVNPPAEPKTKIGDIYQLGEHRLMCGDSTSITDVEKLTNGAKADMVFTDPPYNMAFNGRSGNFEVIKNDNLSNQDFANFIDETINTIKFINAPIYYIWCNWNFYGILQNKLDFKSCIVWAKNVFGLGQGYRHQHEFCLFNGKIDEDITNESDLWEIAKDTNYMHPTQKPIALCARALKNHKKVVNVLDLFGGSGSTLIACEQLKRKCFMMELDPQYCDVIIERWEKFTGRKAVLVNA